MQKLIRTAKSAAVAALCTVGIMSLSGCDKYEKMLRDTPDEYIETAMENTMENSKENKLIEQALKDGSFTLGFEAEGLTFTGVCNVNENESAFSQLFTIADSSGNSAQIYAYAGKTGSKIGTVGQSGSHIYDITYEGIADKLAASIFAPTSDSVYAMPQSDYDMLAAYIDQMAQALQSPSDGENPNDKYAKIFNDYFDTHKPEIQEKTDADIGGKTVSSNIITYSIPTADVKALADSFFDLALEDTKASGQLPEYYTEEDMKEYFNEFMDTFTECGITAAYYVNAKTHALMKSDFTVDAAVDGQSVKIYVNSFFGADPKNAPSQTLDAGIDIAGENASFNMIKSRTENGWTLAASADLAGEKSDLFNVTYEKIGKAYSISASIPDEEMSGSIEGTFDTNSTSLNITVDKISYTSYDGTETFEPKAKVSVKKGGEISALDAEKELLDLTEEEMDALMENIDSDFGAIIEEATGSGPMGSYVIKSKISQANANAKWVHTSSSAKAAQSYVDGNELSGVIEGNGTDFTIGGEKFDFSNYLGTDYYGYAYGYINEQSAVEWTIWSADPLPEEYRHQLTKEEQDSLADKKIFIGCYPIPQ